MRSQKDAFESVTQHLGEIFCQNDVSICLLLTHV